MSDKKLSKDAENVSAYQKEPERKDRKNVILTFAVAILVIALAVTMGLLLKKNGTDPEEKIGSTPKRNVVVNERNVESVAAEMAAEDYVEPGYYTVNMATEWHFFAGDAVSDNARVDNVAGNTNPVYFDVFLAEDETELIYSSPVIPVGSFLENIVLDQPLEKGNYDCVIVYHLVDDDQNTISTLRVAMKIVVDA